MDTTDGLVRGQSVTSTGAPIKVRLGRAGPEHAQWQRRGGAVGVGRASAASGFCSLSLPCSARAVLQFARKCVLLSGDHPHAQIAHARTVHVLLSDSLGASPVHRCSAKHRIAVRRAGFAPAACPRIERILCAQVPVGPETLGRIINVIGEPVDECGPVGERPARGAHTAGGRAPRSCAQLCAHASRTHLQCDKRVARRRRKALCAHPPRGAALRGPEHGAGDPGHRHQGEQASVGLQPRCRLLSLRNELSPRQTQSSCPPPGGGPACALPARRQDRPVRRRRRRQDSADHGAHQQRRQGAWCAPRPPPPWASTAPAPRAAAVSHAVPARARPT